MNRRRASLAATVLAALTAALALSACGAKKDVTTTGGGLQPST